jgi:hypothetical protein
VRQFRLGVLVSAFALAFVLPDAAAASPHIPVASGECPAWHFVPNVNYNCVAEFTVRASNGYRIRVSGSPSRTDVPEAIQISAQSPSATVVYTTIGSITSAGITASLGHLGKFSLRFRPSGRIRRLKVPKSCLKRRPPVVKARLGTFVGTIRFRGERGYTAVSTHRVKGGIGDPLAIGSEKLECEGSGAGRTEQGPVVLTALPRRDGPHFIATTDRSVATAASLSATSGGEERFVPGKGDRLFIASLAETRKEMLIFRIVAAAGPAGDFSFDNALNAATVTPPSPFTGSGLFGRNADGSTSWLGSLSVSVPGLGQVQLTGPNFKSQLTQATSGPTSHYEFFKNPW